MGDLETVLLITIRVGLMEKETKSSSVSINSSAVTEGQERQNLDSDRRDALKKMGLYAAYTAPAMTTLLTSKKATAGTLPDT